MGVLECCPLRPSPVALFVLAAVAVAGTLGFVATRDAGGAAFDAMLEELSKSGELRGGEALGDPVSSRLYRWAADGTVATDGPYAESKEHLAGFFLVDVETQERAESIAARLSGPGETVELRPSMSGGGDDQ